MIIVTADHGEMLGDHGLREKVGYWEQSYAIPCIVRDPSHPANHGTVVERFTENVDVMPTICEAIGVPVPAQCDGYPLTPFLAGERPPWWRSAAHWEFDWRGYLIRAVPDRVAVGPHARAPAPRHAPHRGHAYVQFGNGDWLCFDLAADPTWRTTTTDPAVVLRPRPADADVARSAHRPGARRSALRGRRHRPLATDADRLVAPAAH